MLNNDYKPSTYKQIFLGIISSLSIVSPGICLAYASVAIPAMKSPLLEPQYRLDDNQCSWIASITSLAIPLGCIISGPILDKKGRKFSLCLISVVMVLGWFTIAFANRSNRERMYIQLLIGRFVTGLGTGLCSVPSTVYMSEISTATLRGVFSTWSTISFAIGSFIAYTLGYFYRTEWQLIALISGIIPIVVLLLTLLLIVESPVWLHNKKRYAEAERSRQQLQTLFCPTIMDVSLTPNATQTDPIVVLNKPMHTKFLHKFKYFARPECAKPLAILVAFFFFQQFSGSMVIIIYASDMVMDAGVEIDPYLCVILIGAMRLVASFCVSFASKSMGRRSLSMLSGVVMAGSMFALAGYQYYSLGLVKEQVVREMIPRSMRDLSPLESIDLNSSKLHDTFTESPLNTLGDITASGKGLIKDSSPDLTLGSFGDIRDNPVFQFMPVILLSMFMFAAVLGFLTLPFAMIGEVYPAPVRGFFGGLTSAINYIFNFIVVKTYKNMMSDFGAAWTFFFYGSMAMFGVCFVAGFLPETRGKTLTEIETRFKGKRNKDRANKNGVITEVHGNHVYNGVLSNDNNVKTNGTV